MHVAYSAIRQTNSPALNQTLSRYHGYRAACIKHADTIAQIQRYIPDFAPRPPKGGASDRKHLLKAINNL